MRNTRIPKEMKESLSFLEEKGFISRKPTEAALGLREMASDYVGSLKKLPRVRAIVLSGSAVVGNATDGSDIDLQFIVRGRSRPLEKTLFRQVVVDTLTTSEDEWRHQLEAENAKYLTHTVPVYDPSRFFIRTQRRILREYYSPNTMKREFRRVESILDQRGESALRSVERRHLCEAALALESCFFQACSFLVYCHKGFPSTSLLFSEMTRIAARLGKPDWSRRAMRCLRFDLPNKAFSEILDTYDRVVTLMRRRIDKHAHLVRRLRRLDLGPLCSETNCVQVRDKVLRSLNQKDKASAGLALMYESHWAFFVLSPFFYLKNVDDKVPGRKVARMPFREILACWDEDIRQAWQRVARYDRLTPGLLRDLNELNHEIFSFSSPKDRPVRHNVS